MVEPQPGWSEKEFQRWLTAEARRRGWRVRTMDIAKGGVRRKPHDDERDWPDLLLLRAGRVVWIECKNATGQPTPGQIAVINGLIAAGQEVFVLRPKDWEAALLNLEAGS